MADDKRKLLIATTNRKKQGEMEQILGAAGLNVELVTLESYPEMPEVEETGATFMENAVLKAVAAADFTGLVSIADDGGLCIDALDGQPGVKSHRFLGADTPFDVKMAKILERMHDVPDAARTCRFQSAVVIAVPGESYLNECLGVCEGRIAHELRGDFGFGYDPIFFLPELGRHMAELSPEEKHRISHRGKSLACAAAALREIFA